MSRGAFCPTSRRPRQINPNALHSEWHHTDPAGRTASARSLNRAEKCATSCMIAARPWSWEICRDGEPLPVRLREDGFKSEYTATAAGRVALRHFLEGLAEEESKN
jgi:hypothetical protein